MNKKNLLFAVLCAVGGGMVGCFASHLSEIYGVVLFTIGVAIMVFSISKLSR